MLRIATAIALAIVSTHTISADTHYVSKTGTRTYPYDTWDRAADTVARAVEAASEWDTILIAPGHYVTDTIIMKRGQVVMGSGMDSTFLDTLPYIDRQPVTAADSCTLEDVTFRGDLNPGALAAEDMANVFKVGIVIIAQDDQSVTTRRVRFEDVMGGFKSFYTNSTAVGRRCYIDSCRFNTFYEAVSGFFAALVITDCDFVWDRTGGAGAVFLDAGSLVVERCRFISRDNTDKNITRGVTTYSVDPIVIRNCLFYSVGLAHATELDFDGIPDSVHTGIVENCTFVRCYGHVPLSRPGFVIRNCLSIWSASYPFYGNENAEMYYNITWDDTPWDGGIVKPYDTIPDDIPGHANNVNRDPMFADTIDFLLQAYSPAIDAGDPTILDPDGSRSDIGYTGGPGGFTYTYQDLPPAVPHGLTATPTDSQITLLWRFNHEADFNHYNLYRDTLPILSPNPTLLHAVIATDSTYTDTSITTGQTYYYRLTALDNHMNSSELSNEISVFASGISGDDPITPSAFMLHPNYPNPFNASTRIRYTLPAPAHVTLSIYNALGQHVTTLVNASQPAGTHTVTWLAPDQPSGVYFIVLRGNGITQIRKALLLK